MIVINGSEKSNTAAIVKAAFKLQSSCVYEKCSRRKDVLGLLPAGFGKS